MTPAPTWKQYDLGCDKELDAILARRFGPKHERPCKRPEVITCAGWDCQKAGECQAKASI